jgi:hypothetical protein
MRAFEVKRRTSSIEEFTGLVDSVMMPYRNAIHGPRTAAAFAFRADPRGARPQLVIGSDDEWSAEGIPRPNSQFEQRWRLHPEFLSARGGHVRVLRVPGVRRSSFYPDAHASSMDSQTRTQIFEPHQWPSLRCLAAQPPFLCRRRRPLTPRFSLGQSATPNGLVLLEYCEE